MKDDKLQYCHERLVDEMCAQERYRIHPLGYEVEIENVHERSLSHYVDEMMKLDQIDFYIIGGFSQAKMVQALEHQFEHKTSYKKVERFTEEIKPSQEKVIVELDKLEQTKLHLGFRTNCTFQDQAYPALQVFNGILGVFPSSRLFMKVREQHHLCYYIASRIESHKGLLFVYCGIEHGMFERVKQMILDEIERLKNGDMTNAEIDEIKKLILNEYMRTFDQPSGIIEFLYHQVIADMEISPEEMIEKIKRVTKDEIIEVANRL